MPSAFTLQRRTALAGARSRRPPPAFAVQRIATTGPVALIAAAGELDLFTAPQLRDALDRLPESTVAVILDLRGLIFCDVAGVHAIDEADDDDARRRRRRLVTVPAPHPAHAVFALTGVGDGLEFVIERGKVTDGAPTP